MSSSQQAASCDLGPPSPGSASSVPGGVLISLRSAVDAGLKAAAARHDVHAVTQVVEPDQVGLNGLLGLVRVGRLRVHGAATFPLEDAARDHHAGEAGHTVGTLVIAVE